METGGPPRAEKRDKLLESCVNVSLVDRTRRLAQIRRDKEQAVLGN